MKNKILIELRAAIDVSDNTFIPLCHGNKRTQQYVDGLKGFFKYKKCLLKIFHDKFISINQNFCPINFFLY